MLSAKPIIKKIIKINNVSTHPLVSLMNKLCIMVIQKYPNEPTEVTMLIAIVLLDKGKCLPTIDIGILIAVPPRPMPT